MTVDPILLGIAVGCLGAAFVLARAERVYATGMLRSACRRIDNLRP